MTAKIPLSNDFVLQFPVDEICTTADCTKSGKHRVFVCAFSLLSHSKGFNFVDGGD